MRAYDDAERAAADLLPLQPARVEPRLGDVEPLPAYVGYRDRLGAPAATRAHVNAVNTHLLEGLDELEATVVTPRAADSRGALICVKSTDAKELVATLDREGIVTSDRDGNLRLSAHCYNTVEDVDAVLASLRQHRELLA